MKLRYLGIALLWSFQSASALPLELLKTVLPKIIAEAPSSTDVSSLLTLISQLDAGTSPDSEILKQALQQALNVVQTSPTLSVITAGEYVAILLESLAELAESSTTSTITTSTRTTEVNTTHPSGEHAPGERSILR